jgi:hypothetical protein
MLRYRELLRVEDIFKTTKSIGRVFQASRQLVRATRQRA